MRTWKRICLANVWLSLSQTLTSFGMSAPDDKTALFNAEATQAPEIVTAADGQLKLRAEIRLQNDGEAAYKGALKLKPILLPLNLAADEKRGKGVVLETVKLDVDLAPNQSLQRSITLTLPAAFDAKQPYTFGIVSNTDAAAPLPAASDVAAKARTKLVDIKPTSARTTKPRPAPFRAGQFDLYTEIAGDFEMREGGAYHSLRTIQKSFGTPPEWKEDDLWARFLVADLKKHRLYVTPYSLYRGNGEVDKQWYSIAWNDEVDAKGEKIVVDYYGQAPYLGFLEEGDYLFLTPINSRDLVAEMDFSNNLDLKPFHYHSLLVKDRSSIVAITSKSMDNDIPVSFSFYTTQAGDVTWKAQLESKTWLRPKTISGSFEDGFDAAAKVSFDLVPKNLAAGTYSTNMILTNDRHPNDKLTVPVQLYVYDQKVPILDLIPKALDFDMQQEAKPTQKQLVLRNFGQESLDWSIRSSASWVQATPTQGAVSPMSSTPVSIIVNPLTLNPSGGHEAILYLTTNAPNGYVEFPVTLNLQIP